MQPASPPAPAGGAPPGSPGFAAHAQAVQRIILKVGQGLANEPLPAVADALNNMLLSLTIVQLGWSREVFLAKMAEGYDLVAATVARARAAQAGMAGQAPPAAIPAQEAPTQPGKR